MGSVWRDLKYGLRTLSRNPGFTAVAVLSLALGIGANTAIFTLTNAVFLNPLPVREPAKVLEVYTVDHSTTTTASASLLPLRTPMSWLNFKDFRSHNSVFNGMCGSTFGGVTLTGQGEPKPQPSILVTANYFDVLGVKALAGRTFAPDEDLAEGGNTVAVLSYASWMKLYGGDASAVGRTLELNGIPYTIIGVTPPGFKGTLTAGASDVVFVPMSMHAQALPGPLEALFNERRMRMISAFGRLKPGVRQPQAFEELRAFASGLERDYPRANNGRSVEVAPLTEAALDFLPKDQLLAGSLGLSAIVGLVLLIACVNMANLLLARSARRMREMGIRTALGAERGRLVRQLLTESLIISIAGGAAGLVIGMAGSQLLWSFRPPFFTENSLNVTMDWRVFAFTAAVTLITGALFGVMPAVRTSLGNLSETLKAGGRSGNAGLAGNRLRSVLVVAEVTLSLVALTAAGLLIRSMQRVEQINPGFETKNLFVFNFDIAPQRLAAEKAREFLRVATERAASVPGVEAAAVSSNRPLGGGLLATLLPEGEDNNPDRRGTLTSMNTVSPRYFDTMRIPMLEGRGFTEFDRVDSKMVAIVNDAMARHFWPGQSAIGKRFRMATDYAYREVVGVSATAVVTTIGEQPQPEAYLPLGQNLTTFVAMNVRTRGNPAAVMPAVLKQVQALNGNMALTNPATIQTVVHDALWGPRVAASLFAIFGLLGVVLASVGIYGVMSYSVAQRANEIGLRMALGARPWDVLQLVVGQGMRLTLAGIGMGIVAGLAATRLMGSLLFGVSTSDPVTFASVSVLVAAVALIAGWLPARRAARIDPVRALRQE